MASYNIVLNLKGNATTRVEKLADDLRRANTQAEKLRNTLNQIRTSGIGRIVTGGGVSIPLAGASRTGIGMWGGITNNLGVRTTLSTSGGLSSVFALAGRANLIAGIGLAAFQAIKAATTRVALPVSIARYATGAKGLNYLANTLTSSEMGEGIHLLQRRQQARLGFGESYAKAQERADLLAASYGLDPSNVIASMNVLTGLPIGRTGRRISMYDAERLTQAGGLIAQQSRAPFERVMVNIQQMMSQTVPSLRDIRELLNAAPILSKYAMDEIEKAGLKGVTSMDWLKNQSNIMTVLNRFMAENPAISSMQARGIVQRSRTQFYATLAENPAWLNIATQYEGLMEAAAKGASALLSAFSNSTEMQVSVERLKSLLLDMPSIIDKWSEKLDKWIKKYGRILGYDVTQYEQESTRAVENQSALQRYVSQNIQYFRNTYRELGLDYTGSNEVFSNRVLRDLASQGGNYFSNILTRSEYEKMTPEERSLYISNFGITNPFYRSRLAAGEVLQGAWEATRNVTPWMQLLGKEAYGFVDWAKTMQNNFTDPSIFPSDYVSSNRAGVKIQPSQIYDALLELSKMSLDGKSYFGGLGNNTSGEDISGYGKDRKALVINFNAPIVDWDSRIESTQPSDVVDEVADNLEGMASRAIQIALLGASQKMETRW